MVFNSTCLESGVPCLTFGEESHIPSTVLPEMSASQLLHPGAQLPHSRHMSGDSADTFSTEPLHFPRGGTTGQRQTSPQVHLPNSLPSNPWRGGKSCHSTPLCLEEFHTTTGNCSKHTENPFYLTCPSRRGSGSRLFSDFAVFADI